MPAGDRPRRSTRNKHTIEEAPSPPKKIESEIDGDDLVFDSDSSDDDVASKLWNKLKKPKSKLKNKSSTTTSDYENGNEKDKDKDKPIIPKRKREPSSANTKTPAAAGNSSSSPPPPPNDEIKRKKKDDSAATNTLKVDNKPPTSSLIANMAPVAGKKQPILRDWQPNADFKKVYPKSSSVPRPAGSKTPPPPRNQQQQQQQKKDPIQDVNKSNRGNGISKRVELEQKIHKDLNVLIFEVLEGKGRIKSNSTMKIEDQKEKSNVIDCHGSFLPTDDQERFDFGDLEQDRPVPIFPEDFSSKQKQWPLSWWGIISPSDEVLDMHDGRSRSRGSRERSSKDGRHKDREFSGDRERDRERDRDRDRGPWRDEREQRGAPPPFRGDGWHNNYDYRAGPPPPAGPGGHYGPPPPRERGGWDDPRMNEERWRGGGGGGGGRGFGPGPGGPGLGPSRGGYGPGPFPRR